MKNMNCQIFSEYVCVSIGVLILFFQVGVQNKANTQPNNQERTSQSIELKSNIIEKEVRDNLEVEPDEDIRKEDLKKIESLKVYRSVETTVDLPKFTNLKSLLLKIEKSDKLKPIKKVKSLEKLSLDGGSSNHSKESTIIKGRSLQWIKELKNLSELRLSYVEINDLSFLTSLKNLKRLKLIRARIKDISNLRHLTKLRHLSLFGNNISDISLLSELTNLESLTISHNKITSLSPLKKLTSLRQLSASSNRIKNVEALSNLVYLKVLNLNDNNITNVAPLSSLKKITRLKLSGNNIQQLLDLSKMDRLLELKMMRNPISSIENISTFQISNRSVLEPIFWISAASVQDYSPLKNIPEQPVKLQMIIYLTTKKKPPMVELINKNRDLFKSVSKRDDLLLKFKILGENEEDESKSYKYENVNKLINK